MATKTFEELKQMAIQIRDEKANKQNTATRIGTQMVEHLNKLEQEYYNKENIDEQKEQTDAKFSELDTSVGILCRKGEVKHETILFTKDDVNVGDLIKINFERVESGAIELSFSSGTSSIIKYASFDYVILDNFEKAKVVYNNIILLDDIYSDNSNKKLYEKSNLLTDNIVYTDILKNTDIYGKPIKSENPVCIKIKNTGENKATIFFVAKNYSQQLGVLQDFGYKTIDAQQTLEFETILPATTNAIIVGEAQAVNNTYTVNIMSKNSLQYEVKKNTDKIIQHDTSIEEIKSISETALSEVNQLTESFNRFNPEEFILGQTINPNNGGLTPYESRMAYILKLSSPALSTDTIITNAYGCALMKDGKWLDKIDPIGGTIPKNLTEGADEIRLYFLNQKTTDKFLYINSDISKYIPYGKTLSEVNIEINAENIEKNTEDIKELKESSDSKTAHPMNRNEFATVGDSLCASGQWQNKLVELTGATRLSGYDYGGTTTYGYKENCGQRRLIKLFNEHPNVPYIFLENINDFAKTMDDANKNLGDFNTDIPFMYETHSIDENIQNSYEEAISYWDSNFDTFASSASPQTGYIRVLKYKKAAYQLNVLGKASNEGTFNIKIGDDSYGIAVTTEMTIDDICDAILNYSFTGFTDTAVGSTGNYTGVKLTGDNTVSAETVVSIEENGTGINIQVANVASEAEILYYFNSLKVGHFTDKSKWKTEQEMSLSSFYMGMLQYVVAKFPTARIYWMIMPRFGINYASLSAYYKWENGVINTAKYKDSGLEKAIRSLNNFQKEICDWYLIPYLDVERFCGINYYNASYYYPNGDVHPKEVGYNRWAETVYRLTYGK